MGQIKVIKQDNQTDTGVSGGTFNQDAVSLDGAQTVSAQIAISSVSGLNSCTAKMQISNDPTDETPTVWNDYGSSQNITANGNLYFNPSEQPPGNWLRIQFAAPTGSFNASTEIVVKGPI
jgi:hypothetical protein